MTWAKMQLSVAEHLIKNRIDFIIAEGTERSTTTARYLCELHAHMQLFLPVHVHAEARDEYRCLLAVF